jgi:hypothetical protein
LNLPTSALHSLNFSLQSLSSSPQARFQFFTLRRWLCVLKLFVFLVKLVFCKLFSLFCFDSGGRLVPNETLGARFGLHWKLAAGIQVFQCLEDRSKGGGQGKYEQPCLGRCRRASFKGSHPVENCEGISSFVFSVLLFMFFEEFSLASSARRWCIHGTLGKSIKNPCSYITTGIKELARNNPCTFEYLHQSE